MIAASDLAAKDHKEHKQNGRIDQTTNDRRVRTTFALSVFVFVFFAFSCG